MHLPVNFGRVAPSPAVITVGVSVIAFHNGGQDFADKFFTFFFENPVLLFHDDFAALFSDVLVNLVGQQRRGRALFGRIGKTAEPVKPRFFHKFAKRFKGFFGFAREAGNERCAQHNVGHFFADFL